MGASHYSEHLAPGYSGATGLEEFAPCVDMDAQELSVGSVYVWGVVTLVPRAGH